MILGGVGAARRDENFVLCPISTDATDRMSFAIAIQRHTTATGPTETQTGPRDALLGAAHGCDLPYIRTQKDRIARVF